MMEEFKPFFISELSQIEELYIPKLEGNNQDFLFDFKDPFRTVSSPKIKSLREPLINCLECWRLFGYGEDEYEKEYFPCTQFKKGDHFSFRPKEIPNYLSDKEFQNRVKNYFRGFSERYFNKFEDILNEINADANQKKFIAKFIEKIQSAIMKILDLELNKYNRLVAGELIKGYIFFIEKIVNANKIFFPEFIIHFEKKIDDLRLLYENNFGFINELDYYIYRDCQNTFLEYEKQLFPNFLTSEKTWRRSKNDLVRYYIFLDDLEIFKNSYKKSHLKNLKFLSDRYNIQLEKQTDPNRISNLSPKPRLFDFLK